MTAEVRLILALARRRDALGLTQAEVARRMGTSQSAVTRLENGGVDPRLSSLLRYARAVGAHLVTIEGLVTPDAPVLPPAPIPTGVRLTWRQRKVFQAVRQSVAERGYPPTLQEIGDAAGLSSQSGVIHNLRALERAGLLTRRANQPRAIALAGSGTG